MFAKSLILAFVLAGVSLGFIGNLSAAPVRGDAWQSSHNYTTDRHRAGDSDGF